MNQDLILQPPKIGPTVILSGAVIAQVATLEERMIALPTITDQASADAVGAVMKEANRLLREIDAQRYNAKRPWAEVANAIDAAARPVTQRLDAIKTEAKLQTEQFIHEQNQIRLRAAEAARIAQATAEAALKADPAAVPQLQVTVLPQQIQLPTQERSEVEVYDMTQIPDEYWVLDMVKLRKAVLQDGLTVPGARITKVTRVVTPR